MTSSPCRMKICFMTFDSSGRSYRTVFSTSFVAKVFVVIATSFLVTVCIFYGYDLYHFGKKKRFVGWFSAAAFVMLTFPISFRLIYLHLTHWYQPRVQKYIVRIVWMVPVYSIESWLALRFQSIALYIETFRECYEAYVIFNFLYYLIALLGEEATLISILKEKTSERGLHPWPVNLFLSPWIMGHELLSKCKLGVLQYVILKNLTAIITCILENFGVYGEGQLRFDRGYIYLCFISNSSQLWALYCLIMFYVATKEELLPWRPLGKFLCVKMVVFFTWWQSVALDFYFVAFSSSKSHTKASGNPASKGIQDYAICVEMLVASIAFTSAFTYKDFCVSHPKSKQEDPDPLASPPLEAAARGGASFLSAFAQSSLPDEMFADIRRVAKGLELSSGVDSASGMLAATHLSTSHSSSQPTVHPAYPGAYSSYPAAHAAAGPSSSSSNIGSSGSGVHNGGSGSSSHPPTTASSNQSILQSLGSQSFSQSFNRSIAQAFGLSEHGFNQSINHAIAQALGIARKDLETTGKSKDSLDNDYEESRDGIVDEQFCGLEEGEVGRTESGEFSALDPMLELSPSPSRDHGDHSTRELKSPMFVASDGAENNIHLDGEGCLSRFQSCDVFDETPAVVDLAETGAQKGKLPSVEDLEDILALDLEIELELEKEIETDTGVDETSALLQSAAASGL